MRFFGDDYEPEKKKITEEDMLSDQSDGSEGSENVMNRQSTHKRASSSKKSLRVPKRKKLSKVDLGDDVSLTSSQRFASEVGSFDD